MRSLLLCGLILIVLGAAAVAATYAPEQTVPNVAAAPAPERPAPRSAVARPRDPWVFRCVLDQRPRMVVIALHENLWVAYDATNCSLYKAWKGDVKFQGAVYDHVHGPQPMVRGIAMLNGIDGANWVMYCAGSQHECTAIWKGYRITDNRLTLLYEVHSPNIAPITIEEEIEVDTLADGSAVNLMRSFRTRNVANDCVVAVKVPLMNARGDGQRLRITLDGREVSSELASVEVLSVGLKSNDITELSISLEASEGGIGVDGDGK